MKFDFFEQGFEVALGLGGGEVFAQLFQSQRIEPAAFEFARFFVEDFDVVGQDKRRHAAVGRIERFVRKHEPLRQGGRIVVVGIVDRHPLGMLFQQDELPVHAVNMGKTGELGAFGVHANDCMPMRRERLGRNFVSAQ